MRRRRWKDRVEDEQAPSPPDDRPTARDEWEQQWGRPEAERVARWLRSKGAAALDAEGDETARAAWERWALPDEPARPDVDGPAPDEGPGAAVGAGATSVNGVPSHHPVDADVPEDEPTPQQPVNGNGAGPVDHVGADTSAMAQERASLVLAVEALRAELVALEEQRERMVAEFEAEQAEMERARQLQRETYAHVEREVSVLQHELGELRQTTEAAAAAAERARIAEQRARSDLEAAEEKARKREAARFEVWVALDAEIAALERRRDEVAGKGGSADE